jgi:hypothetical protein
MKTSNGFNNGVLELANTPVPRNLTGYTKTSNTVSVLEAIHK